MTVSHSNTPASRFSKAVDDLSVADNRLILAGCLLTYADETFSVHVFQSVLDSEDESITTHIHSADANPDVFTDDNISLDSLYNYFVKGGETECN